MEWGIDWALQKTTPLENLKCNLSLQELLQFRLVWSLFILNLARLDFTGNIIQRFEMVPRRRTSLLTEFNILPSSSVIPFDPIVKCLVGNFGTYLIAFNIKS